MTYQDYVDLVVQTVAKNLTPSGQYITTAALGGLLLKISPEENWKNFGKRTLWAFIGELETQGKLTRIKTEKGALAVTIEDTAPAPVGIAIEKFNPLRKPVWDAFILLGPEGKRFMHRRSGVVRLALKVAPVPADDWLEISPIDIDTQKAWAREFLQETTCNSDDQLVQSLNEDWQPQTFVQMLRKSDESTARSWNHLRTAKVSSIVHSWLIKQSLPHEFAFQTSAKLDKEKTVPEHRGEKTKTAPEDLRRLILAAVANLPLEKLLEIPIPAGVMLTALSDAKLR